LNDVVVTYRQAAIARLEADEAAIEKAQAAGQTGVCVFVMMASVIDVLYSEHSNAIDIIDCC
jgi:hypothetical protein